MPDQSRRQASSRWIHWVIESSASPRNPLPWTREFAQTRTPRGA